ncbi:MAG: hypothetical protein AABX61_00340 [Nanoarchaeota archaeon]
MKKHFILIFLSLLLVLSGCSQQSTTKTGTFLGGTNGVSIELVNLAPPSQFSQNDSVKIKVLLKNNGETKIATGNAKARIFGVELSNFGLTSGYRSTLGPLEAQGEFTKEGGQQEIDFGNIKYKLPIINSDVFTLRARLCYPYQTKASVDVCIKSSLSQESGEQICDVTGEKIGAGSVSGAPIQITSITEQTRSSDQVRFDIVIENKGKGEVYPVTSRCEDLDDEIKRVEVKNQLNVKVNSPVGVLCSFRSGEPSAEGVITLDSTGKETLSCWKNVDETVQDKLSLTLNYVYRDQATKQITIYQSRR